MQRHYYISDDLDDLSQVEHELQEQGLKPPQFHVLSENDAEVEKRHLHAIEPVLKKDVVRLTELGALFGLLGAALLLVVAYVMQWYQSTVGWLPFVFSALVTLGFCTWQGGLIGIQMPNRQFQRFSKLLAKGKHVFFVDFEQQQEPALNKVISAHPAMHFAGSGKANPAWWVKGQDKFQHFMKVMP